MWIERLRIGPIDDGYIGLGSACRAAEQHCQKKSGKRKAESGKIKQRLNELEKNRDVSEHEQEESIRSAQAAVRECFKGVELTFVNTSVRKITGKPKPSSTK